MRISVLLRRKIIADVFVQYGYDKSFQYLNKPAESMCSKTSLTRTTASTLADGWPIQRKWSALTSVRIQSIWLIFQLLRLLPRPISLKTESIVVPRKLNADRRGNESEIRTFHLSFDYICFLKNIRGIRTMSHPLSSPKQTSSAFEQFHFLGDIITWPTAVLAFRTRPINISVF